MSKTQSKLGVTVENSCGSIDLQVTPQLGDSGALVTLHVNGMTNVHPQWNTWEWQSTNKFGIGIDYNTTPVWTTFQTGGTTAGINGDDTILRVKLTIGQCTYYSNESGYLGDVMPNVVTPYVSLYKDTQTFIEGSGATKLDFSGATINNSAASYLSTSVINDNFVSLVSTPFEMSYSGHLSFEIALETQQNVIIAAYVNNVIVPQSKQVIAVPSGPDIQLPFSKTFIIDSIAASNSIDLRFDPVVGDITVLDTSIVIKGLNYTIQYE